SACGGGPSRTQPGQRTWSSLLLHPRELRADGRGPRRRGTPGPARHAQRGEQAPPCSDDVATASEQQAETVVRLGEVGRDVKDLPQVPLRGVVVVCADLDQGEDEIREGIQRRGCDRV